MRGRSGSCDWMLLLKEGRVGAAVWRSRCSVSCQWVDEWWWRCKDGEEVSGRVTERAGLAGLADARMAKSCISLILRLCCAEQTGKQQTWRASRQLQTHQRTNGRAGGRATPAAKPAQPAQPATRVREGIPKTKTRKKKSETRGKEKKRKRRAVRPTAVQCRAPCLSSRSDHLRSSRFLSMSR